MSRARGLLTPLIVTAIGVGTGVAIFDPAFKQNKEQKEPGQYVLSKPSLTLPPAEYSPVFPHRNVETKEQHAPSPSPEEQIRKTEEAVASAEGPTRIPEDVDRWAKVQSGQFSKPVDTFRWSDVSLDRCSTPEKPS